MYVLYEYNVHYIYNKMYISVIWSCTPIFATQKEGEPSKRERTAGVLPLWGDGRGGIKKPCGCRMSVSSPQGCGGNPVGRSPRGYDKDTAFLQL